MLIGVFKGSGKRLKRASWGRQLVLYGIKFQPNRRIKLTEEFIKEAGLDNKDLFGASVLSLKTDYGLVVIVKGEHKFTTQKQKVKVKVKTKVA